MGGIVMRAGDWCRGVRENDGSFAIFHSSLFTLLHSHLDTPRSLASYISLEMPSPIISIFSTGDYEAHIASGSEVLRGGGLVVLPTETAYGAAALLSHPA